MSQKFEYFFIFLLQYCVQKSLVWRGPKFFFIWLFRHWTMDERKHCGPGLSEQVYLRQSCFEGKPQTLSGFSWSRTGSSGRCNLLRIPCSGRNRHRHTESSDLPLATVLFKAQSLSAWTLDPWSSGIWEASSVPEPAIRTRTQNVHRSQFHQHFIWATFVQKWLA